jgi:selenocysteine-specific translation elongation factor
MKKPQKTRRKKLPLKTMTSHMKRKYMRMMSRRILKSHLRAPYRGNPKFRTQFQDKLRMKKTSLVRRRSKMIMSSEETPTKIRGNRVLSMKSSSTNRFQSAATPKDLKSKVP